MRLKVEPYLTQVERWPKTGRHILAQYDDESVVVYQAYRPEIGQFAASNGYFGGQFSLSRMSWIKPNFLWMMYRSGWGTISDQEVVLAISIKRSAFEQILSLAVPSVFVPELYPNETVWKEAVNQSSVRLQWDPDHDPRGCKLERRAIQLGLRKRVLSHYANDWIIHIEDISQFVREQFYCVKTDDWTNLLTPSETVYPVSDEETAIRLGIDNKS